MSMEWCMSMKTNEQYNQFKINEPPVLKGNQVYDNKGNIHEVDFIDDFYHGIAFVKDNNECYFINESRMRINDDVYTSATNFEDGYAIVKKDKITTKHNYLDLNGLTIFYTWLSDSEWYRLKSIYLNRNFTRIISNDYNGREVSRHVLCKTINMRGFLVRRVFGGYRSSKGKEVFYTTGEPIMLYGSRYVLCINDKEEVYLYDRNNPRDIRLLGKAYNIEFERNIIIDKFNNKAYIIKDDDIVDITDYYKLYLKHHWNVGNEIDKRPSEVLLEELKSIVGDLEELASIEDGDGGLRLFNNQKGK